jgi:hypothetical protein
VCAAPSEFEYKSPDENLGDAPTPRRARKTMIVGRIIGWFLVAAGIVILTRDLIGWINAGLLSFAAAGELWFMLHDSSLNLIQAVTQRYVFPQLWDPIAVTVLLWPAFLVVGVPGLILSWVFRRRPSLRPKSATD